jgi:hypothetical protein
MLDPISAVLNSQTWNFQISCQIQDWIYQIQISATSFFPVKTFAFKHPTQRYHLTGLSIFAKINILVVISELSMQCVGLSDNPCCDKIPTMQVTCVILYYATSNSAKESKQHIKITETEITKHSLPQQIIQYLIA